jgi:pimeloyl-ACP methyl ester carboxylesterase
VTSAPHSARRRVARLTPGSVGVAVAAAVGSLAFATRSVVRRYRRDMRAAQARLGGVDREKVTTALGDVAFADRGAGEPLLVIHGIFQNCESALLLGDLIPDRRLIAPCRFGYLGSAMPSDATPARQADAYVELLDALGIARIDVVGISAGATSAFQLALRHPGRVEHLVVLSGNLPGATTATVQPSWARYVNRQFPIWALKTFAPRTMARLAGVPKQLAMGDDEKRFVAEFLDSLFPLRPSIAGVDFDAFVSNADVNGYDLEAITVPTMLVHTKDDPLVRYDAAKRAAPRIPGAQLLSLESGGHLLLGHTDKVRQHLTAFLGRSAAAIKTPKDRRRTQPTLVGDSPPAGSGAPADSENPGSRATVRPRSA